MNEVGWFDHQSEQTPLAMICLTNDLSWTHNKKTCPVCKTVARDRIERRDVIIGHYNTPSVRTERPRPIEWYTPALLLLLPISILSLFIFRFFAISKYLLTTYREFQLRRHVQVERLPVPVQIRQLRRHRIPDEVLAQMNEPLRNPNRHLIDVGIDAPHFDEVAVIQVDNHGLEEPVEVEPFEPQEFLGRRPMRARLLQYLEHGNPDFVIALLGNMILNAMRLEEDALRGDPG
jgi:hypothetical protein